MHENWCLWSEGHTEDGFPVIALWDSWQSGEKQRRLSLFLSRPISREESKYEDDLVLRSSLMDVMNEEQFVFLGIKIFGQNLLGSFFQMVEMLQALEGSIVDIYV